MRRALFCPIRHTELPTTFMIDSKGKIFGYVESALTGDIMESIVQQTMNGKRDIGTVEGDGKTSVALNCMV